MADITVPDGHVIVLMWKVAHPRRSPVAGVFTSAETMRTWLRDAGFGAGRFYARTTAPVDPEWGQRAEV